MCQNSPGSRRSRGGKASALFTLREAKLTAAPMEEMLAEARGLREEGKFAKAKSTLVVATCLYPDAVRVHFELWLVCGSASDWKHASRALAQGCATDAMLDGFSAQLIAELQQPGSLCGRDWLQGEREVVARLLSACLSKVGSRQLAPDADATQREATWQLLVRLAQLASDHPLGLFD